MWSRRGQRTSPGVTSEDDFRLAVLLGKADSTALRGIFLWGVVLAGLGVLNDVTITQASAVWELRSADPGATRRDSVRHTQHRRPARQPTNSFGQTVKTVETNKYRA